MATVPVSGTNIRILSNIPFSSDYKHTRWFDTQTEQTNYFLGKNVVHSMEQANFQRIEGRHIIAVNESIDKLHLSNYVMFQNAQYNNRWFYAFITKLEYKQRGTTWIHFEIDVVQTWMFYMRFNPSFVEREHRALWNADGTPVLNTLDEGLDYGTDYETVSVEKIRPYGNIYFLVIVAKEVMHEGVPKSIVGSLNGSPQPLTYYIAPFRMPDGQPPTVYVGGGQITAAEATDVLRACYVDESAVNNIVSVYITDYFGENLSFDEANNRITFPANAYEPVSLSSLIGSFIKVNDVPSYDAITMTVSADKYDGCYKSPESKLLMHPYTVFLLDDLKGNRVEIKPEYINGKPLQITIRGSLGTSNKVSYSVANYLLGSGLDVVGEMAGTMEHSVIDNNANDLPIINDYLASYLQGNRNSLENQKAQILFNGTMGTVSAGLSGIAASPNALGVASAATSGVQSVGSAHYQLQGLEAKKNDISNVPATLAKMGSNTNFDFGNNISGLFIIKKQLKAEYRQMLSDYFNMFGYKVNRIKTPNFHTRQYWNFVKTVSCNITGNFNNEDLQELKNVFDNGITLWHTDDVGNYALVNEVL